MELSTKTCLADQPDTSTAKPERRDSMTRLKRLQDKNGQVAVRKRCHSRDLSYATHATRAYQERSIPTVACNVPVDLADEGAGLPELLPPVPPGDAAAAGGENQLRMPSGGATGAVVVEAEEALPLAAAVAVTVTSRAADVRQHAQCAAARCCKARAYMIVL